MASELNGGIGEREMEAHRDASPLVLARTYRSTHHSGSPPQ